MLLGCEMSVKVKLFSLCKETTEELEKMKTGTKNRELLDSRVFLAKVPCTATVKPFPRNLGISAKCVP